MISELDNEFPGLSSSSSNAGTRVECKAAVMLLSLRTLTPATISHADVGDDRRTL